MNNKSYDAAYRSELLELIETGWKTEDVAREYGVSVKTVYRWMGEKRRERRHAFSGKRRNPEYPGAADDR